MDIATLIGIIAGIAAVISGFLWEGGQLSGLLQKTAALIVFGGTIAAVVASFPTYRLRTIPAALRMAFGRHRYDSKQWVEELIEMSTIARRSGVLALERKVIDHPNPFLQDGIQMVVDGTDPDIVRQILEMEIDSVEQKHEGYAKIFEAAGGYAPTMGIIGTVMGLIQVLGSLTDPTGLGPAIAVAFTATLYGVASANLIFLPIASKIKSRSADEVQAMEMMLEGVLAIQNGENPQLVRKRLESFTLTHRHVAPSPLAKEGLDESAQ
ncbi:flagellar motor protein [Paenibacillus barcinonensis]|uniref:Chemotaxis protein MotA n=1 Tax=Paenibacillus barcinonensis TaxID=198119 RepID=A0A2V4VUB1_PAEBA|nr:flagellar motor protein [Paenibacillus barcinonensis]PYE50601.1 chemotaxis protein MotA [Paenibacillus barcinonensis]QKS57298.1 flagellar motor protein [Paenibacillus barcinonensis]